MQIFTCYVLLVEEGKLGIYSGSPGNLEYEIWETRGKDDRPSANHPFATFENGQFVIYRGTPEKPKIRIYETRKPADQGSYKFGITVSKRLAVYSEAEGKRKTLWMSPARD